MFFGRRGRFCCFLAVVNILRLDSFAVTVHIEGYYGRHSENNDVMGIGAVGVINCLIPFRTYVDISALGLRNHSFITERIASGSKVIFLKMCFDFFDAVFNSQSAGCHKAAVFAFSNHYAGTDGNVLRCRISELFCCNAEISVKRQ